MTKKDIRNSKDTTLERNTIKQWEFLISEYLLVKNKKHPKFTFVNDFYKCYNLKRQNFNKYYNRYKNAKLLTENLEKENKVNKGNNNDDNKKDLIYNSLLPKKRGPKYLINRSRFNEDIINRIKELRINYGLNRYDIRNELEKIYNKTIEKVLIPSYTSIYNILKNNNMNVLDDNMIGNSKKNIKRIIKDNIGDLGHIDCHYLPKNIIKDNFKDRYYLIGLIDDKSRILSLTVSKDIKAITVMFKTLEMINFLKNVYNIEFKEILSDNGSEFGSGKQSDNKDTHPFERLLKELNIKHTKPSHPQTNGKIERVWRIIDDELLGDSIVFDSEEELKEEIMKYNIYYNEYRKHSSLDNKTPKEYLEFCHRNS